MLIKVIVDWNTEGNVPRRYRFSGEDIEQGIGMFGFMCVADAEEVSEADRARLDRMDRHGAAIPSMTGAEAKAWTEARRIPAGAPTCEVCERALTNADMAAGREVCKDGGEPVAWLCGDHRPVWRLWLSIEKENRVTGEFEEAEQVENYLAKFDTYAEAEEAASEIERQHPER